MTETQVKFDDRAENVNGKLYAKDGKGALVPVEMVKAQHKLEDELVYKIFGHAEPLSDQISRFKDHTFDDINAFDELLAQQYDAKKGGKKGNKTYMSFDGLRKVQVAVAEHVDFGAELQVAKMLIDDCINGWSADGRPELRVLVTKAFNTDQEGKINRNELLTLKRLDIEDERWQRAMQAISDATRVIGSKIYVRMYQRSHHEAAWEAITIDLAKA